MICEGLGLANTLATFDADLPWACAPVPTQCVGDATCDCVPSVVATYVCAKNIDGVGCGMDDAGLTIVCVAH